MIKEVEEKAKEVVIIDNVETEVKQDFNVDEIIEKAQSQADYAKELANDEF